MNVAVALYLAVTCFWKQPRCYMRCLEQETRILKCRALISPARDNVMRRPISCVDLIPILCTLPLWDLLTVSSPSRQLVMVYEAYHQHQGDGTACHQSVLIHFIWSPVARFSARRKSNLGLRFMFENFIRKHNNSQFVKGLNKTKLRNYCKLCAS